MSGGFPAVFDGPWGGMNHSFSALTFIWSLPFGHVCPLITSCSFHKDTNHIGLEPILITLLKISTSVVTLFLN